MLGRLLSSFASTLLRSSLYATRIARARLHLNETAIPQVSVVFPAAKAWKPRGSPFQTTRDRLEAAIKKQKEEEKKRLEAEKAAKIAAVGPRKRPVKPADKPAERGADAVPVIFSTTETLLENAAKTKGKVLLADSDLDTLIAQPIWSYFSRKSNIESLGFTTDDCPTDKLAVRGARLAVVATSARMDTLIEYAHKATDVLTLGNEDQRAVLGNDLGLQFNRSTNYVFELKRTPDDRLAKVSILRNRLRGDKAWRDDHFYELVGNGLAFPLTVGERLCHEHVQLIKAETKELSETVFSKNCAKILDCDQCKALYLRTNHRNCELALTEVIVRAGVLHLLGEKLEGDQFRLANIFAIEGVLTRSAGLSALQKMSKEWKALEKVRHTSQPPRLKSNLERLTEDPIPARGKLDASKWLFKSLQYL